MWYGLGAGCHDVHLHVQVPVLSGSKSCKLRHRRAGADATLMRFIQSRDPIMPYRPLSRPILPQLEDEPDHYSWLMSAEVIFIILPYYRITIFLCYSISPPPSTW
jgi:hypothetical protein